jgi:hypothetical protein
MIVLIRPYETENASIVRATCLGLDWALAGDANQEAFARA